uniref:Uncharacterized protein n=1 Tax=Meloidogyne incognita TaxID=6306 RepID=A0A914LMT3_MELIC
MWADSHIIEPGPGRDLDRKSRLSRSRFFEISILVRPSHLGLFHIVCITKFNINITPLFFLFSARI